MIFLKPSKILLSCIMMFFLSSCIFTPEEEITFIRTNKFQSKIHKIKHNFFLVWPHQISNMPESENIKLKDLVQILSKANEVEVEIIPVYKKDNYNNYKILNREFLIRDVLCGFGIPINKIFIKRQIEPQKYEEGFIVNVILYQLEVPNCDAFKDDGVKSLEDSVKSFGCATVANFGKLIAYPSSLDKYKKTLNDRSSAISAVSSIQKDGGGGGY